MKRAKADFTQQLNVYRRKYEDAVACNKRLQKQLGTQATNARTRMVFTENAGVDNKVLMKQIKVCSHLHFIDIYSCCRHISMKNYRCWCRLKNVNVVVMTWYRSVLN